MNKITTNNNNIKTTYKNQVKKGDKALLYVSGSDNQYFFGEFTLSSSVISAIVGMVTKKIFIKDFM